MTQLHASNITVAGNSAARLYGSDNQPLASFPYKANGEILTFMSGFKGFENMYEAGGDWSWPYNTMKVKNFATKSPLPNTQVAADGACFFEYARPMITSTGAVKIIRVNVPTNVLAEYLDIRNLPDNEKIWDGNITEVAFSSIDVAPQTANQRINFNYDTGAMSKTT